MQRLTFGLGALVALSIPVLAAEDPIAARQTLMWSNAASAAVAGGMMKGEIPYSPAVGKSVLAAFDATSAVFGDYFPEGSLDPARSKAIEAIWTNAPGFAAELQKFQTAAAAGVQASGREGPADLAAFQAAVGPVFRLVQDLSRELPRSGLGQPHAPPRDRMDRRARAAGRRGVLCADDPARAVRGRDRRRCPKATRRGARRCSGSAAAIRATRRRGRRATTGSSSAAGRRSSPILEPSSSPTSRRIRRTGSAPGAPAISPTRCCTGSRRTGGTIIRRFPTPPMPAWSPATWPISGPTCGPCPKSLACSPATSWPFPTRCGVGSGCGSWRSSNSAPVVEVDPADPVLLRGRYLAEGPGHCGECHTPRNFAGALETARWFGGAPNPDGDGRIPNITGGAGGHRRLVRRRPRLLFRDRVHSGVRNRRRQHGGRAAQPRRTRPRGSRCDRSLREGRPSGRPRALTGTARLSRLRPCGRLWFRVRRFGSSGPLRGWRATNDRRRLERGSGRPDP